MTALFIEGTDAFDALEQMAADLRKQADELDPPKLAVRK